MNTFNQGNNPLKIAFFGSPHFSASLLKLLQERQLNISIEIAFTQPNKPAGRKQVWRPTPVKQFCQEASIPVFDKPLKENLAEVKGLLNSHGVDLAILFAFNEIVPSDLLRIPRYGFWNIHPSLLPKYRGPSPVSYPLILGDLSTGVTLMQMDATVDTGDIIGQVEFALNISDNQQMVLNKVPSYAIDLIKEHIYKLGEETYAKQHIEHATSTRKLKRADGYVALPILQQIMRQERLGLGVLPLIYEYYQNNPSCTPPKYITIQNLFHLWQGLYPWPGVWTLIQTKDGEKRLKILGMQGQEDTPTITQVQMEGRNGVSLKEFRESYPGIL